MTKRNNRFCFGLGTLGRDAVYTLISMYLIWFLILSYSDEEYSEILDMLPVSELSFISEYGSPEDTRSLSLYLGEYGREICSSGAIETLSRL